MADGGVPARGQPFPARRAGPASRRGGRNGSTPVYTKAIADEICDRLSRGESLRSICRDAHMPSEMAVRLWAMDGEEAREGFASRYARARQLGFDSIAEEILDISDENPVGPDGYVDNGAIQRARHRTDSRRWYLSKLLPSKFGDKVTQEIVGNDEQPLITRIELVPVDPRPARTIDHEPGRVDGYDDRLMGKDKPKT